MNRQRREALTVGFLVGMFIAAIFETAQFLIFQWNTFGPNGWWGG